MLESVEQKQERVRRHLVEARARIEADISGTEDAIMQRIEADAATVVTLSIVKELLPEQIRAQVQAIIDIHEAVWTADNPVLPGVTPRKPLGTRLLNRFSTFTRKAEEKLVQYKSFLSSSQ
ncbi:MAG: hypothetical protein NVS2B12_22970 [Ktedonobacteraceae bacterium]